MYEKSEAFQHSIEQVGEEMGELGSYFGDKFIQLRRKNEELSG